MLRKKGETNQLGALWKWITATPGFDDFIKTNNRLDYLIMKNN